jgi:hypothetical protein
VKAQSAVVSTYALPCRALISNCNLLLILIVPALLIAHGPPEHKHLVLSDENAIECYGGIRRLIVPQTIKRIDQVAKFCAFPNAGFGRPKDTLNAH